MPPSPRLPTGILPLALSLSFFRNLPTIGVRMPVAPLALSGCYRKDWAATGDSMTKHMVQMKLASIQLAETLAIEFLDLKLIRQSEVKKTQQRLRERFAKIADEMVPLFLESEDPEKDSDAILCVMILKYTNATVAILPTRIPINKRLFAAAKLFID